MKYAIHMNNQSALDGHFDSLYWVLTLTTRAYTEALLKDRSAPCGDSYSLYQVLTITARPTRRLSWKTEVLLTVAHTAYIESSSWRLTFTTYIGLLAWQLKGVVEILKWITQVASFDIYRLCFLTPSLLGRARAQSNKCNKPHKHTEKAKLQIEDQCVYYKYIVTKVQVPTSWLLSPPINRSRPDVAWKAMPTQLETLILSLLEGFTAVTIQLHHFCL